MLTVKQVADRLAVSASCVYQLVALGTLECYRIGGGRGTLRFSEEQFQAYLERARVRATPPPSSAQASSASRGGPFSELDPDRLRRAWEKNR